MLLPLMFAAASAVSADTIPEPAVRLLGHPVDAHAPALAGAPVAPLPRLVPVAAAAANPGDSSSPAKSTARTVDASASAGDAPGPAFAVSDAAHYSAPVASKPATVVAGGFASPASSDPSLQVDVDTSPASSAGADVGIYERAAAELRESSGSSPYALAGTSFAPREDLPRSPEPAAIAALPVGGLLGTPLTVEDDFALAGEPSFAGPMADLSPSLDEPLRPTPAAAPRVSLAEASLPLPGADFPGQPIHAVDLATDVGFQRGELDRAVDRIATEVRRGSFPGAAFAVGRWDRTVIERGIGTMDGSRVSPVVDPDHTIYDLASLTKVVGTTTAVMLLVEDGRMDLDAPVSRYLPGFTGGQKGLVTIRHLLTHRSGLPAGASIAAATPQGSLARAISVPLATRPGQRVEYSDIGFIVLWAAAEAANGGPLEPVLRERVFEPLDMWSTGFLPGENCVRCAPTLDRSGYRGVVHDPLARQLGGIAGHAGLFSTLHDLSRFAAMLAGGGELDGVRVLSGSTLALFTERQLGARTRALGWDTPDESGEGAGGLLISPSAFGHTGFTGTSLWVDPVRGTWVVLLSNRTFDPRAPNRMQELRREVNDRVATSIDLSH